MGVIRRGGAGAAAHLPGRLQPPQFLDRQGRRAGTQACPDRPCRSLHDTGRLPSLTRNGPQVAVLDPRAIDRHPLGPGAPGPVPPRLPARPGGQHHRSLHLKPADQPAGPPVHIGEMRMPGAMDLHLDPVHALPEQRSDRPRIDRHRGGPAPLRPPAREDPVDPQPIAAVRAQVQHRLRGQPVQHHLGAEVDIGIAQIEGMRRADPDRTRRHLH